MKTKANLKKHWKKRKKQMSETNKKFADAMKELNKIWKDQKQEYKTLVNAVKTNKIDFRELLDDGYTEEKEHIANKYTLLRKGVESDKSLTDEQKAIFKTVLIIWKMKKLKKHMITVFSAKRAKKFLQNLHRVCRT